LGESEYAAFMDAIIAEAYDHIGQVNDGWQHRRAACRVLSNGGAGRARETSVLRNQRARNDQPAQVDEEQGFMRREL